MKEQEEMEQKHFSRKGNHAKKNLFNLLFFVFPTILIFMGDNLRENKWFKNLH